jgi:hypothetical protein
VQRGKNKYVVDHHHTLAALDLFCKSTETDLFITMERIRQFDKSEQNSLTDEAFWGLMEGKGWAFLRDENYNRTAMANLPVDFSLSSFRNDIYRSMGGFARVYEVLKRGKELDDMLFFEFRWGFFFWCGRACLVPHSPLPCPRSGQLTPGARCRLHRNGACAFRGLSCALPLLARRN